MLNLINLAGKTGTLIVDGPVDQAYVSFREGKLAAAADAYNRAMASEENKAAGRDLMSFAKDIVIMMIAEAYEDEVRK